MISDQFCLALANLVTSPPTPADALAQVHEHFLSMGNEWSGTAELPGSLEVALLRPASLNVSELDRAAVQLRRYILEMPCLAARLASATLLLARLGGRDSRAMAGRYYVAALFPPACIEPEGELPTGAGLPSEGIDSRSVVSGDVIVMFGDDGRIDERLIVTCKLARSANDALRSAENALDDLPQNDSHFAYWCNRADALRREWQALFNVVCTMAALTPAGRFVKAQLAEHLTKTEPVGPMQDDGLRRLSESMARDHERAKLAD